MVSGSWSLDFLGGFCIRGVDAPLLSIKEMGFEIAGGLEKYSKSDKQMQIWNEGWGGGGGGLRSVTRRFFSKFIIRNTKSIQQCLKRNMTIPNTKIMLQNTIFFSRIGIRLLQVENFRKTKRQWWPSILDLIVKFTKVSLITFSPVKILKYFYSYRNQPFDLHYKLLLVSVSNIFDLKGSNLFFQITQFYFPRRIMLC